MKATLIILGTVAAVVGFVAFGSNTNLFVIKGAPPGAGGELTVCGRATPLKPWQRDLIAIRVTRCEGGGSVSVRSVEGGEMRCAVGYVEPHHPKIHRLDLSDGSCT